MDAKPQKMPKVAKVRVYVNILKLLIYACLRLNLG